MTFNNYKKIPLLRWPEEARQLNVLSAEDRSIRNPTLNKQIAHQLDESVKLRAAGNGTPAPLITLTAGRALLPLLLLSGLPELTDCGRHSRFEIAHTQGLFDLTTLIVVLAKRSAVAPLSR